VLIRDLPADVHANLQRRAEAAGQSLQQYLTKELSRIAESPRPTTIATQLSPRHWTALCSPPMRVSLPLQPSPA